MTILWQPFGPREMPFFLIRLCCKVLKASGFFSMAKIPFHPALCRPKERPPQPANKSMYEKRFGIEPGIGYKISVIYLNYAFFLKYVHLEAKPHVLHLGLRAEHTIAA